MKIYGKKDKQNCRWLIFIGCKEIEVSEEIYKAYMRDEWRENKRRYRSWRCRDSKGMRCKERCDECPYYSLGNDPIGSDLSIEQMMNDDGRSFDIPDLTVDIEAAVLQRILHDDLVKARETLSEREKLVFDMVFEGRSERDIAIYLNVSPSRAHVIKNNLLKKLRGILSLYEDFFHG